MRSLASATLLTTGLLCAAVTPAPAQIMLGAHAPDFSKAELVGTTAGPQHTLYQHASQPVVVLFLLGYS